MTKNLPGNSVPENSSLPETESLQDFMENAPVAMHFVNGSGIIIWVNQAELDMLGYSREEVLNKHITSFHADKDNIEEIMQRLINKETLHNYPARLLCKNGKIKDVIINSNVFSKDDRFIHTRCFTIERNDAVNLVHMKTDKIRPALLEQEMPVK